MRDSFGEDVNLKANFLKFEENDADHFMKIIGAYHFIKIIGAYQDVQMRLLTC